MIIKFKSETILKAKIDNTSFEGEEQQRKTKKMSFRLPDNE
jgi:hypothetical protein